MNIPDTSERVAQYQALLDSLTGMTASVSNIEPVREPSDGRVIALAYADFPEPGYVTGFTYGLSLVRHAEWGEVGRELTLTVRSDNIDWAQVPARSVAGLRGFGPFRRGQVLGHAGPYVPESEMSAVVLGEPALGSSLVPSVLDLGEHDEIELVGAQPIHRAELQFVREFGADALHSRIEDRFSTVRGPVA